MMPTINQLVRKSRKALEKKSTAPALQKGYNSLNKKVTDASAPQKRGVCKGAKQHILKSICWRNLLRGALEDSVNQIWMQV